MIAQKTQRRVVRDDGRTPTSASPRCSTSRRRPSTRTTWPRETFVELGGVVQPAPAPRFSATPGAIQGPPPAIGAHDSEALGDWGFSAADIDSLKAAGALAS